jgi:hypothetical protein
MFSITDWKKFYINIKEKEKKILESISWVISWYFVNLISLFLLFLSMAVFEGRVKIDTLTEM